VAGSLPFCGTLFRFAPRLAEPHLIVWIGGMRTSASMKRLAASSSLSEGVTKMAYRRPFAFADAAYCNAPSYRRRSKMFESIRAKQSHSRSISICFRKSTGN